MTAAEAGEQLVEALWQSAGEALASARSELAAGRARFAVNRAYYAAFDAVSAVLLRDGQQYAKHTAVRAAMHRDLVHAGRIEADWGTVYAQLYEARHEGDYALLAEVTNDAAEQHVAAAASLVARLRAMANRA